MLYRSLVCDLFYGTMMLIAGCVEVVRERAGVTVRASARAALGELYVFSNIRRFNESFASGRVDAFLGDEKSYLSEDVALLGTLAFGAAACLAVIMIIREAILLFYSVRRSIATEFKIVAQFLEINSASLSDRNVARRQEELAKSIADLADRINVQNSMAESVARDQIRKEVVEGETASDIGPVPAPAAGATLI